MSRYDRSPCDGCDRLVVATTLTERLGALLCVSCSSPPIDPCRAAISQRPLCAGSFLSGRRHRVGADRERYVVWVDGRRWLFCTPRCLAAWSMALAGAAS